MSVSIQLHPLAVLNISDHLTRDMYQKGTGSNYRVIGLLLGKQHGRSLDIVNTVEIKFRQDRGQPEQRDAIDERFSQERLEAYKKLFPDLDCIGWYSAQGGKLDAPTPSDLALHKKFMKFTENPLLAILSPESAEATKKKILPLFLYELESGGQSGFLRLDYSLATSDSERIAVDNVSKSQDSSALTSTS
jgi:COP9 signalosome complex subunit 6